MMFLRFTGQPRFLEMECNSSTIGKRDSSLRQRGPISASRYASGRAWSVQSRGTANVPDS